MATILLVDDDDGFASATTMLLEADDHTVVRAASVADARDAIENHSVDLMLTDLALPDGSGLELLGEDAPQAVVITGHPSVETAVRALRQYVVDYLVKPIDRRQLTDCLARVLAGTSESRAAPPSAPTSRPAGIIGESAAIRETIDLMTRYAASDGTVLIMGESGTGKDLIARGIHELSNPDAPYVAVNCGAIPAELIASELFGHAKGAFTGATKRRAGHFERAGKGTVFLDEVTELPAQQQVALLRILENRVVTPVGGDREISVQCRIIAASNRDIEQRVADGEFREDLYYRLMVLPIRSAPLRERADDIPLLANYFLAQIAAERGQGPDQFSASALRRLSQYQWPGNVRELKHVVMRASVMSSQASVIDELPANFERPMRLDIDSGNVSVGMSIRDMERQLIERTLAHFSGDRAQTAEALGISVKTLYNRLKEYEQTGDAA